MRDTNNKLNSRENITGYQSSKEYDTKVQKNTALAISGARVVDPWGAEANLLFCRDKRNQQLGKKIAMNREWENMKMDGCPDNLKRSIFNQRNLGH